MKYYLKSNENFIFLKNKKDILSFNISAFVVDINFNYITNRNNEKNRTIRTIYFNTNQCIKFFEISNIKFNNCLEDFFKNQYIAFFNQKYPYRAISDINVCNISLVEVAKLDFDKNGLFMDVKCDINYESIFNYPNNLMLCESRISYLKNNKNVVKVIYSFDTKDVSFNHNKTKSKEYLKGNLELHLNNLTQSIKEKNKKLFRIDDKNKISNVKILDILKTSYLSFE